MKKAIVGTLIPQAALPFDTNSLLDHRTDSVVVRPDSCDDRVIASEKCEPLSPATQEPAKVGLSTTGNYLRKSALMEELASRIAAKSAMVLAGERPAKSTSGIQVAEQNGVAAETNRDMHDKQILFSNKKDILEGGMVVGMVAKEANSDQCSTDLPILTEGQIDQEDQSSGKQESATIDVEENNSEVPKLEQIQEDAEEFGEMSWTIREGVNAAELYSDTSNSDYEDATEQIPLEDELLENGNTKESEIIFEIVEKPEPDLEGNEAAKEEDSLKANVVWDIVKGDVNPDKDFKTLSLVTEGLDNQEGQANNQQDKALLCAMEETYEPALVQIHKDIVEVDEESWVTDVEVAQLPDHCSGDNYESLREWGSLKDRVVENGNVNEKGSLVELHKEPDVLLQVDRVVKKKDSVDVNVVGSIVTREVNPDPGVEDLPIATEDQIRHDVQLIDKYWSATDQTEEDSDKMHALNQFHEDTEEVGEVSRVNMAGVEELVLHDDSFGTDYEQARGWADLECKSQENGHRDLTISIEDQIQCEAEVIGKDINVMDQRDDTDEVTVLSQLHDNIGEAGEVSWVNRGGVEATELHGDSYGSDCQQAIGWVDFECKSEENGYRDLPITTEDQVQSETQVIGKDGNSIDQTEDTDEVSDLNLLHEKLGEVGEVSCVSQGGVEALELCDDGYSSDCEHTDLECKSQENCYRDPPSAIEDQFQFEAQVIGKDENATGQTEVTAEAPVLNQLHEDIGEVGEVLWDISGDLEAVELHDNSYASDCGQAREWFDLESKSQENDYRDPLIAAEDQNQCEAQVMGKDGNSTDQTEDTDEVLVLNQLQNDTGEVGEVYWVSRGSVGAVELHDDSYGSDCEQADLECKSEKNGYRDLPVATEDQIQCEAQVIGKDGNATDRTEVTDEEPFLDQPCEDDGKGGEVSWIDRGGVEAIALHDDNYGINCGQSELKCKSQGNGYRGLPIATEDQIQCETEVIGKYGIAMDQTKETDEVTLLNQLYEGIGKVGEVAQVNRGGVEAIELHEDSYGSDYEQARELADLECKSKGNGYTDTSIATEDQIQCEAQVSGKDGNAMDQTEDTAEAPVLKQLHEGIGEFGEVSKVNRGGVEAVELYADSYSSNCEHADLECKSQENGHTDLPITMEGQIQCEAQVIGKYGNAMSQTEDTDDVLTIKQAHVDTGEVGEISWVTRSGVETVELNDDSSGSDSEQTREQADLECKLQENGNITLARKEQVTCDGITSNKRTDDGAYGLKKNSRVWCLNSHNKWRLGIIQSTTDSESIVSIACSEPQSGLEISASSQSLQILTSKLLPANPDILEGVDNLIQLSYLNEPTVLHNLKCRFDQDKIYTRAGPVLVAVNPFKKVFLYTDDFIQAYKEKGKDNLGPHVYMTADSAFRAMMTDGVNQSIIISGESGAGKTETAKISMQYLAALGGGGGFENEILQTNPILEAFGNAKTLRNDNSSRFGKLIDIYFEDSGKICGAKIQTYLLEKSRVVHQAKGERSYHIFYQLCAGADPWLRDYLNLRSTDEYHYLNQSGCMTIDNIDDAAQFHMMLRAMDVVQLSKEDQESAFKMLAAVLWLGNISFSVVDNENHVSVDDNDAVKIAAKLLRCGKEHLMWSLSTRRIYAGHENIVQKLTYVQAVDSRDALAKAIYANLFDWLVDRINKSLEVGKCYTGRSISILDIYGFESFEKNSFEQLCINYANERLQQFFNRHLFKLEQEEYSNEGIDWTKVDFVDNQECLDLIEKRPLGLISLLDEECTFPKGTDLTLSDKWKRHLIGNNCFKGERGKRFRVRHYAGEVIYDATGLLEKNRDLLHSDLLQLLASCETQLPQLFAANINQVLQRLASPLRRNGVESQKQSVATKFKGQLSKLMQRLETTVPHFIRCIKPNTLQLPGIYQQDIVLQQLHCCGVLEVVRISKSGYPTRPSHQEFANRYGFLLQNFTPQQDALTISVAILQQFNIPPDMYQVGFSKLFFRAGQIGRLEDSRAQALHGILYVQRHYRGYKVRCHFKELRRAVIFIQSLVRSAKARQSYKILRQQHQATIVIQKFIRSRAVHRDYVKVRKVTVLIQSVVRGWLGRRACSAMLRKLEEKRQAAVPTNQVVSNIEADTTFDTGGRIKEGSDVKLSLHHASDSFQFSESKETSDAEMNTDRRLEVLQSQLASFQGRFWAVEAALQAKEDENALLQQRLEQYDKRWLEYEARMTTMEETWQKQMAALQLSSVQCKRCLAPEEPVSQEIKQNKIINFQKSVPQENILQHLLPPDDACNWEDSTFVHERIPDQSPIPQKLPLNSFNHSHVIRQLDAGRSVVNHLVKEFEHQAQAFDDNAKFLVAVKSGQTEANLSPDEELWKLKQIFDIWKLDFKVRLRETKGILHKFGNINSGNAK